jgi:hypothetical protein
MEAPGVALPGTELDSAADIAGADATAGDEASGGTVGLAAPVAV